MRRSSAPRPADPATVEKWENRLRDDPSYWGRFSIGLVLQHVRSAADKGAMPRPFVALEYLLVMDAHLRNQTKRMGPETLRTFGDPHSEITIPRWVFNALADAFAAYLSGSSGATLTDAFVGKASKQGQRSHSPKALCKRRRDFSLTFNVIALCLNEMKAGTLLTLDQAFATVADAARLDAKTVESAYRNNLPLIRPYLEREGAPIIFPD